MANYIENFNGKLDWAMPFQRTGKFPLDRSCMFSSYNDAVLYASGGADTRGLGGTSYVGQLIVVFENDVVTVYKINADRTIEALTSESGVNADVLDLQNQLNAEIKARKEAIDALDKTIDKTNGNFDISITQTNGLFDSLTISDIHLTSDYSSVVYPEIDSTTFTSAKANDTLDVAIKTVDQNVATLVQEVLNNEEVVAAAITEIKESVGLNENLKYVANSNSNYISEATTFSEADSLLDAALANEVANRQSAIDALDSTVTSSTTNVGVTVVQTNGKLSSVTLTQNDIASASALTAEIAARKAVDGQTGQTYVANTTYKHISAATSLNDADVKLNDAITAETKARQDAIDALDARYAQTISVDSNGKATTNHIGFDLSQLDGKITGFSITEKDIASAYDLSQEIAARKAVDGQTGQTYAKNSGATYISAATSLNDADVKLNNAIANLKITSATSTELTNLGTNVKEAYKLIDGNSTQHGNWIKIYKDSSLQEVYLGLSNDTINTSTGVITKNTVPSGQVAQSLNFKYQLTDGTYSLVKVDISKFLAETEYADGLQVSNGVISVKKDSSSESFLSVSSNGVKLSGVQNAIDTAVNNLDATVSGNGTHVDVTVSQLNGKITGVSVAESDIASAAALTAEITARKAVDGQTGQTYAKNTAYTHISAATSLNDADIRLNNAITAETKARQDAINALDATVSGNGTHVDVTVSQLNGKITGVSVAESDIASASALTNLTNWCAYMSGHTTVSAVTSIPTTKRLCIATISSSQTLGLNGSITDGREVHIIVKNNSTSDITVTIPSSIKNLVGENLIIEGSSYGEINLTSDGTNVYYRGVGK